MALKETLFNMRKAIDNFYDDKGRYPKDLRELVPNYVRRIPPDPITKRTDTWITTGEPSGVFDVHSGAQGITCDGTAYSAL